MSETLLDRGDEEQNPPESSLTEGPQEANDEKERAKETPLYWAKIAVKSLEGCPEGTSMHKHWDSKLRENIPQINIEDLFLKISEKEKQLLAMEGEIKRFDEEVDKYQERNDQGGFYREKRDDAIAARDKAKEELANSGIEEDLWALKKIKDLIEEHLDTSAA